MIGTWFLLVPGTLEAQNCIATGINGTVINQNCSQACSDLNFQVPHLKSSSDYKVITIPYNPYPYLDPSGRESRGIYADDQFGDKVNMPFPFCFYDSVYNAFVVGSNGLITFDTTNANCSNAFTIDPPIPYDGGVACMQNETYYPRASIMGAFSDLDPRIPPSLPDRKIMWYTEGSAPCRKYVISFYHVGTYSTTGACNTFGNTFQIVLHESTGIIEVFFEQKTLCPASSNGGSAILGIQNWNRDKALAAPGKNATQWKETKTGYQFIPSGGASRYIQSGLYELGGAFVATADTSTTRTPGILNLRFPNVCPPSGNATYVVKTDYSSCSDPLTQLTSYDTIYINRNFTATVATTASACSTGDNGTVTVTVPAGTGVPPYNFLLDGVTSQVGASPMLFSNVSTGAHNVVVTDFGGCVTKPIPARIFAGIPLTSTVSKTDPLCNGQDNGTINLTTSGGLAPYQYSVDGGVNWQNNNIFNVRAGDYMVITRDANNCTIPWPVTITEPAALTVATTTSNASCNGGKDGRINMVVSGGKTPYQYSLDGTSYQVSAILNVDPGNYIVTVKDNAGCIKMVNAAVGLTNDLTITPQTDAVICEGTSMQLQLNSNATVYAWTPSAGLNQNNVSNPVANPGVTTPYIVTATLGRCSANDTVVVQVNAAPIANAGTDGFICYGQSYTLLASGGASFKWTPSSFLNSSVISNPVSTPDKTTIYSLFVTDALGCSSLVADEVTVDVTPPIHVQNFPADTIGYSGDQFQLLATSVANMYAWSPAAGLSDPSIPNPVVTLGSIGDDITYKVIASTIAGCKGEGYARVRVYAGPDIYVPTGFTPNNDGKNDKFIPFPVGIKKIKYFRVFNRWGQMLYSTTTPNEGWDGKFEGRDQVSGVYVWMAEAVTRDDRLIMKKGTVALIR
jgi:gliding motility-associated-like protein